MYQLHQFNPEKTLRKLDNISIAIYGTRRSGKTFFCEHYLFNYLEKYDIYILFSNSVDVRQKFDNMFDVIEEFDEQKIEEIIEEQNTQIEKNGINKSPHVFILFDDCLHGNLIHQSKSVMNLAENARHMNIAFCLTSQRPTRIPPTVRDNSDIIFILDPCSRDAIKILYQYILDNNIKNLNDFTQIATQYCHNHGVLCYEKGRKKLTYIDGEITRLLANK